jgi:phi13 family phage major tail protein
MANTNKVKYGLTNVYYAVATIDASDNTATYGTPKRIPGAVNLSMDHQGDANTFYADNIAFFTLQGDAGYSGSLEIAQITDDFRKDILGEVADANGCLTEVANAPTVPFALLFQFDGDINSHRLIIATLCFIGVSVVALLLLRYKMNVKKQVFGLLLRCGIFAAVLAWLLTMY